ncbi:uncharacterized protein LOC114519723 [Dendronephthya gigantea]|uniref:uncharacterized protein LOC114519723 n=1 Tax=Dendronephthya gigantea TaxID=151771 RepID=UPI00106C959C|nr:uncharacterized protein LOC114519723 [Dendronephthya gigantea]
MAQGSDLQTLRDLTERTIRNSDVQPDDSVSNIGSENYSRLSLRSRASSRSSTRSSASAKARAKRAVIEAEIALIQRFCAIEEEELRLQQRKRQLELQKNLAKAEAEERAYAEQEELETFHTIDQTGPDQTSLINQEPERSRFEQSVLATKELDDKLKAENARADEAIQRISLAQIQTQERHSAKSESPHSLPSNPYPQNVPRNDYTPHNTQPVRNGGDIFVKLLESQDRQSHMFNQLLQQQQASINALTLPHPDLPLFDGDPTKYCDFIRSFENLIEMKTSSPSSRLYYLVQYTTGQVQELMRSCLPKKDGEGYREARKLLSERFGQPYKIACALVDKIANGPTIKADDGAGLQKLSVQLTSCSNTLTEIGYVSKLQNPDTLKKIVDRLPVSLRVKWRELVDVIIQREDREFTVKDLTDFVVARARVANHPIFGKIHNDGKNPGNVNNQRPQHKARNYATDGFQRNNRDGPKQGLKCPSCESNHWLSQCQAFKKLTVEDRHKLVRRKNLCINCLVSGHFVKDCPKGSFCRVSDCKEKHSTFLHPKRTREALEPKKDKQEETPDPPPKLEAGKEEVVNKELINGYVKIKSESQPVIKGLSTTGLAVVPVKVKAKGTNKTIETYAFLDNGSNTSFCTERLLEQLEIDGKATAVSLTTMESVSKAVECSSVNLKVFDLDERNFVELSNVFSRPRLPVSKDCIANQGDVKRWPHLTGIKIEEIDAEVGLLIGSDVPEVLQPLEVRKGNNGGPFATRTIFGWVLNGPLGRRVNQPPTSNFADANPTLELTKQFEKFCNMEFNDSVYDPKTSLSQNDRKAMRIMEASVKLKNDHYEIALPWKNYPPCLENNKPVAEHRLNLLKKRLQRDPTLLSKYAAFMEDLLSKGYAQCVQDNKTGPLNTYWYLPHHPVFHPKKPEKTRVVFDCSAKYRGTSLNDQLLQGPDLTNSLVGVLTRFREERVALTSDVEAMFHQVLVRPSDCDALRFLWWPNGNLSQPPEEFQMRVHLFGGASSPSCANFALRKTAEDNKEEFDPVAIETVNKNFYVDDCLKSTATDAEAIRLASQLRQLLAKGGFRLTKWMSNSREVMKSLPESERAPSVKELDFEKEKIERALGLQWNVVSDQFGFKIILKERPQTRRVILSIVSSIYDPLGFVAPFIFQAKLFLQDLCRKKLDWDDVISEEDQKRWKMWLDDLPKLENVVINRCLKPANFGDITSCQVHNFSDASQVGYGAVTYLRLTDNQGNVSCSFVMGKSRLAPLKSITVPRMELSAAVLATRLDKITRQELSIPVDESFFWTDSTCVLRYIENDSKRFQTFVANRVAAIRDSSSPSQWNHVATQLNPADEASRGVPADEMQRWIHGPEFLSQPMDSWPRRPADIGGVPSDDPEIKESAKVYATTTTSEHWISKKFERVSSWNKLKRVVAWALRYKSILRERTKDKPMDDLLPEINRTVVKTIRPMSVSEINEAEREILRLVQRESYHDELTSATYTEQPNSHGRSKSIKKSSSVYKLDPMLVNGLLCVGGRLQQAPIDDEAKHPIILPKKHHIVTLIVRHFHALSGHSGTEHTLSLIRRRYWIVKGRSSVRSILSLCFDCKRRQAPVQQQKMASLPVDRVTPSQPPFTCVGVDCFGPFVVRRGRSVVKRYGVLFTCLAIRAVHVEVAHSLDTASFINALRRFIARRGTPKEMRSDNGGNFIGGEKELREAISEWNQTQVHEFLLQRDIKWTFNPPASSHFGGVWERCIRTVRKVLNALLKEQVLDDEGLATLMCEVESVINGRPITKLSDDPRDLSPLTPNHLLLLRSGPVVPPGSFVKNDKYGQRRWRQVQYLADIFWRRWTREYLPMLQERQVWNKTWQNIAVDDVVLVVDEKTPRGSWPLGRVLEVHSNRKDGLVRSLKVKTGTTVLTRAICKIVLLEAAGTLNDK